MALLDPQRRQQTARDLAHAVGAEELMVFVRDEEVDAFMPAPGFPQTLIDGRSWRSFLSTCVAGREARGRLRHPLRDVSLPALGLAGDDGSILILIGGDPHAQGRRALQRHLPLLGAALRGEQSACMALGRTKLAEDAVQKAALLMRRLDATRRELQQALAKAEEVTRAKDEFLAVISHELRSPLSAILSWSHLLQHGSLDDEARRRAAESIERNAKTQAKLVEDILDYSRIVSGRLRLDLTAVDLSRVIDSALDTVRPRADEKGVTLDRELVNRVPTIAADPDRLQQVLTNLLSNAVTYTGAGGRVSLALETDARDLAIRVRDTGVGIEPAFLPHVFEAFRQADGGTTRRHGGLGLGLSISRRLVELHGGHIEAHSAGKHQGTTFTVRLPLRRIQYTGAAPVPGGIGAAPPLAMTDSNRPLTDLDVLIVDDDEDTRVAIVSVLEQYGARPRVAANVSEALAMLDAAPADCVISDISMPGEDGYSLVRKLRAAPDPERARTPAIALTAHARAADRLEALSAGYEMHFAKPVEPQVLVRAVASLARRREGR